MVPAAVASAPYTSEQYADVLVEADKVISQEDFIIDKTLSGKIKGEEGAHQNMMRIPPMMLSRRRFSSRGTFPV